MQDTELFLSLAEIAGVFVGFGALISVRGSGTSNATEVSYIRGVVWAALWVVIAALAPVIMSRYGVAGHDLWRACSLLAIVLWLGLMLAYLRAPETREDRATYSRAQLMALMTTNALFAVPMLVALVLVVLGLVPDQEPALYLTAVGLSLCLGSLVLLELVFSQRRPQTAPDPVELPATGGSSA